MHCMCRQRARGERAYTPVIPHAKGGGALAWRPPLDFVRPTLPTLWRLQRRVALRPRPLSRSLIEPTDTSDGWRYAQGP